VSQRRKEIGKQAYKWPYTSSPVVGIRRVQCH